MQTERVRHRCMSMTSVLEDDFVRKFASRRVKTNNGHFDHLRSKEVLTLGEYLARNASEWNLFFADMAYSLQRILPVKECQGQREGQEKSFNVVMHVLHVSAGHNLRYLRVTLRKFSA